MRRPHTAKGKSLKWPTLFSWNQAKGTNGPKWRVPLPQRRTQKWIVDWWRESPFFYLHTYKIKSYSISRSRIILLCWSLFFWRGIYRRNITSYYYVQQVIWKDIEVRWPCIKTLMEFLWQHETFQLSIVR